MNKSINLERERERVTKAAKDVDKGGIPWHQVCFSDGIKFLQNSIKIFLSSLMVDTDWCWNHNWQRYEPMKTNLIHFMKLVRVMPRLMGSKKPELLFIGNSLTSMESKDITSTSTWFYLNRNKYSSSCLKDTKSMSRCSNKSVIFSTWICFLLPLMET